MSTLLLAASVEQLAAALHALHIDGDCKQPEPDGVCVKSRIVARALLASGAVVPLTARDLTPYTDDLAAVVAGALDVSGEHPAVPVAMDDRIADAILESPVLAQIVADAERRGRAEAWNEGARAADEWNQNGARLQAMPENPYTTKGEL